MRSMLLLLLMTMLTCPISALAASYEEASDLLMERRYAQKLQASGRYDEALKQAQRVLATSRKLFGTDHREISMSLDTIASILRKMGRFGESEQYFMQALQISRKLQREQPHDYAAALQNLAGLYRETGRYRESEQLYQEAIATLKQIEPKDDEALLSISGNLAMLYQDQGRYAEAEPILKAEYQWALKQAQPDSLAIRMNLSMDNKRLFLAERMSNLAGLYLKMRRAGEAMELTAAALEVKLQTLTPDDPRVMREMNNLGMIYRDNGREKEAEPLLRQAVESARKVYGNQHPELAIYLDNLALLYQRRESYQQAEQLQREAVFISQQALGSTHPNTLMQRNNLAVNYLLQDRYADAELQLRALLADSRSGSAGSHHPEVATRMTNLADALRLQGKHLEAHRLQGEALRISERKRDDLFLLLTEQQKLSYLRDEMAFVRQYLAHTRQVLAQDPGAASAALDTWLRWKGIVMESQGRYLDALYRTDDPALKRQFDELIAVRRELAGLQLIQPNPGSAQSHAARIELLEYRKEHLEADLTKRSAVYAKAGSSQRFTSTELRRLLPKGAAYIDFALVEDWQYQPLELRGLRYLAFIVSNQPGAAAQLLDLGPANSINQATTDYRRQIAAQAGAGKADPARLAAVAVELHSKLVAPLLPYLQGVSSLIISPDAGLHLLPFEILRGKGQPYLLEQYAISYVGSGRDMARFGSFVASSGKALLFADPDYDLTLPAGEAGRNQDTLLAQLTSLQFNRLPDTKVETDAIAGLLRQGTPFKVQNLVGRQALESTLLAQSQPRILHLATHGFFLQDELPGGSETRGLKAVQLVKPASGAAQTKLTNPMLRSGIALAGVNRSLAQGQDNGLVTAEKILGMRLLGTDLVTLSACETGVGDIKAGEGVFGLKRAFILAGAKTVVLSLWSVPSRETTELMTEFYRLMAAGTPKAAALRQAQRTMLKKYPHPFYWGAFQLVGSPD
ncbi:Tetratricopeptide repeat-containing protein [Trichlorobacter thiogenes]|uniref:Tetratricopeptide repeat-containing protein n=1 Tax=Trichlorobacter thiogenes TaxID=115783 RepID=A0A1T4KAV2_9BACT|nr:CHAT domain-containing tetratricopeptide repeat protein [Trichlorobacter thiogenes]SJZ39560.1 Tetratricopeptide repeat-containing protein [Trichlorobacter thiogenes]